MSRRASPLYAAAAGLAAAWLAGRVLKALHPDPGTVSTVLDDEQTMELLRAMAHRRVPYRQIDGARGVDGDTFVAALVDLGQQPYMAAIWGLRPVGEQPDLEASLAAYRDDLIASESDPNPSQDTLDAVDNVDAVIATVPDKVQPRAVLEFCRQVMRSRLEEVEAEASSDVDAVLLQIESSQSNTRWLYRSPRRVADRRLSELVRAVTRGTA